jgi:1-deoxy-D-xylulose-5-phosphate reductoisomerase
LAALSFEPVSSGGHPLRFPGLGLAWDALAAAPGTTAILNAANEVAVAAFLDRKIRFDQIHFVNLESMQRFIPSSPVNLGDLLAIDEEARARAQAVITKWA